MCLLECTAFDLNVRSPQKTNTKFDLAVIRFIEINWPFLTGTQDKMFSDFVLCFFVFYRKKGIYPKWQGLQMIYSLMSYILHWFNSIKNILLMKHSNNNLLITFYYQRIKFDATEPYCIFCSTHSSSLCNWGPSFPTMQCDYGLLVLICYAMVC